MRLMRVGAVVVVGLAMAAAGCGGDDDDGGGLSKSEFQEQAGKICTDGDKALEAIPQPADISDATQAETYLSAVLATASDQIDKMKALEPADDYKADYDKYISELEASKTFVTGILDKAKASDPSGLQELQAELQAGTREKAINDAANKLGVSACAS